ncbi:amino acid ABC transporter substrate-binding protein [Methylobacterium nodulans]|uniref:Extracellular solute-binding protein family 3 n=1 Tax=Methylobacterium nodulans (strain LMG 21967 / CNCM I-2342 / ORS 2060) TaxID=460265 RepID=B8IG64_METNO|nr:amino acid ABC transporter substrate-binding protein [Methylobacterium nodulans]ACL61541.1 extracellular solute-binding protein family 3 [Methylobacterium nodulans ORS 2060]
MRIFGMILAMALAMPVAAAPTGAGELTGTLKKIKDSNRIVLGVRDGGPPFSYIDNDQKYVGYTIDICDKIIDAIKKEINAPTLQVEMNPVTSSTRIPLMTNGTIDLECGSTTNNPERQKQVTFTNAHFVTTSRFASKKAQNINKIDDLKGKTVVSVAGSTNLVQINKVNSERKLGLTIQAAKDTVEAFLLLETDRAAAFVMDDVQLSILIALSKDPAAYTISEDAFALPEPYGIMLRRNDEPFKAVVDRATADLYRSPEIAAIYKKWFESPVPPKGINYRFPMPAELRRAFEHPTDSPDPASYKS